MYQVERHVVYDVNVMFSVYLLPTEVNDSAFYCSMRLFWENALPTCIVYHIFQLDSQWITPASLDNWTLVCKFICIPSIPWICFKWIVVITHTFFMCTTVLLLKLILVIDYILYTVFEKGLIERNLHEKKAYAWVPFWLQCVWLLT